MLPRIAQANFPFVLFIFRSPRFSVWLLSGLYLTPQRET